MLSPLLVIKFKEKSDLQIRGVIEDISKIFFLISQWKHILRPLIRLKETVLMMGHKICFYEQIWLIIPKLPLLPLLNWSTGK